MGKHRHVLENVDQTTRTGTCRFCGPVEVRAKKLKSGAIRWVCVEKKKEMDRKHGPASYQRVKHRQYGISDEQFAVLQEQAGGLCTICLTIPRRRLVIDHDHATGKFRGLLCHHCNVMLGMAKDNSDTLQGAIEYLQLNAEARTFRHRAIMFEKGIS